MLGDLPPLFFVALGATAVCGALAAWIVWRWLSRAGVWRRLAGAFLDEEGTTVVEFPFAVLLLLVLTLLTWEFGRIAASFHVLDWAAWSTARAATVILPEDRGQLDRVLPDFGALNHHSADGRRWRLAVDVYGAARDREASDQWMWEYPGLEQWAGPRREWWSGEIPNVLDEPDQPVVDDEPLGPRRRPPRDRRDLLRERLGRGPPPGRLGAGDARGPLDRRRPRGRGRPIVGRRAPPPAPLSKGAELWHVAAFACTPLAMPFESDAHREKSLRGVQELPWDNAVEEMILDAELLFGPSDDAHYRWLGHLARPLADLPAPRWASMHLSALAHTRIRLQAETPRWRWNRTYNAERQESFLYRAIGVGFGGRLGRRAEERFPQPVTTRAHVRGLLVAGGELITVELEHDYRLRMPFVRNLFRIAGAQVREDGHAYVVMTARCAVTNEGFVEIRPAGARHWVPGTTAHPGPLEALPHHLPGSLMRVERVGRGRP